MFRIFDGRENFFQWDLNQKLIVEDAAINEVHFCNRTDENSLVCETYSENGLTLVNVPNILLQQDWSIRVYAVCADYTKAEEVFKVMRRSKPSDYVYTETEVKSYEQIEDRLKALEEREVQAAGVSSVNGKNGEVQLTAEDVGAVNRKYVNDAIADVAPKDITEQILLLLDEASSADTGGGSLTVFYWIGLRLLDMMPAGKYTGLGGILQADITYEDEYLQSSELYMTLYNTKVYITCDINSGLSSASGYVRSYINDCEYVENYSGGLEGNIQLMPYRLGGLCPPADDADAANKAYVDGEIIKNRAYVDDAIKEAINKLGFVEEEAY